MLPVRGAGGRAGVGIRRVAGRRGSARTWARQVTVGRRAFFWAGALDAFQNISDSECLMRDMEGTADHGCGLSRGETPANHERAKKVPHAK